MNKIWLKINTFAARAEKSLYTPYRIVFVDNVDELTPSSQQALKKIMEDNDADLKFMFICTDPKKLIGNIQTRSFILRKFEMSEQDALELILKICVKEKIGFEREGIQEIIRAAPSVSPVHSL